MIIFPFSYVLCKKCEATQKVKQQKILFFLNYIDRARNWLETDRTDELKSQFITLQRVGVDLSKMTQEYWQGNQGKLCEVSIVNNRGIETSDNTLHIDFANEYLGGGVLRRGAVQEEVLLLSAPENLVWLAFCQRMDDNEALLMTGGQRFSQHQGYAKTFAFKESIEGKELELDLEQRPKCRMVAIDAIRYEAGFTGDQFKPDSVFREINKAYSGFQTQQ